MSDTTLKLEIDPSRPGIAHIVGQDSMACLLLGMRCARIVACVNAMAGIEDPDTAGYVDDIELSSMRQCKEAWLGVFNLLEEISPGWCRHDPNLSAGQSAIAAIRRLKDHTA